MHTHQRHRLRSFGLGRTRDVSLSGHGLHQQLTTDSSGGYRFLSLHGSTYTIAVDSANFSRYENSSVHVSNGSTLDWRIQLTLQSASQSITVQGDHEALEQVPTVGKTGTLLQDIPQSISVIGHTLSDLQGDLELRDTVLNAPGVIQGGTDGFSDGDERNGIPHSLNGVERVEILEGPGSSLFGSGPPGGTINLVHYTPSLRFATGAQFQTGSFGLYSGSSYLTGGTGLHGLNYRVDGLAQHTDDFRALQGGEGSVELSLTRRLKLTSNATGMHASLTKNPSNLAATGRRPQGVPNRIVNFWTSYDLPLHGHDTFSLAGGFTNRSSMFADLLNTNSIPSYTTADLVANMHAHGWNGAFGVRNLTDTRYSTAANGAGGFVGDARTYFGKLQFQFGNKR